MKTCQRKPGDCIEGDDIYIECRKPIEWQLFHKSNQHRGSYCKAKKGAKATIVKAYTNIASPEEGAAPLPKKKKGQ